LLVAALMGFVALNPSYGSGLFLQKPAECAQCCGGDVVFYSFRVLFRGLWGDADGG
jgi:hypothetical protein